VSILRQQEGKQGLAYLESDWKALEVDKAFPRIKGLFDLAMLARLGRGYEAFK
jgi:hypothetical protein